MALIKSKSAAELTHDAIVLDLGDLRKQARAILDQAEAEARRVVEQGRAEARRLTESAEQQGYDAGHARGLAEGHEAGRQQGREEAFSQATEALTQLQDAWIKAAQQWDNDRRQMLIVARQSLLKLAIELGTKVVHRVPQVDPTVVQDQVAAAIEHVARPCDVTVRVHSADIPLVEQAMGLLVQQFAQAEHVSLEADDAIQRGGCVVTYGQGRIDATLDTQLERLVATLLPAEHEPQQPVDESPPVAGETDDAPDTEPETP